MESQEPDLPSYLKQQQNELKKTMFFKTLDMRQQRTVVPERQETNEVSVTTGSILLSRMQPREGELR